MSCNDGHGLVCDICGKPAKYMIRDIKNITDSNDPNEIWRFNKPEATHIRCEEHFVNPKYPDNGCCDV